MQPKHPRLRLRVGRVANSPRYRELICVQLLLFLSRLCVERCALIKERVEVDLQGSRQVSGDCVCCLACGAALGPSAVFDISKGGEAA